MKPYTSLLVVGLAVALSGCKWAMMVPAGGEVESSSHTRDCDGRSTGEFCTFDITTDMLPLTESFTAQPKPGFEFVKWQDGSGFLCADSTNPVCTVSLQDNDLGRAIVALYTSAYLMPVFKDVGFDPDGDGVRNELDEDDDNDGLFDEEDPCPLNPDLDCGGDTIVANGKEWFQPDLFVGLSRSEIEAVCSSDVCSGVLNGLNMNDWIWAASNEVQALFESYGPASGDYLNCPAVDLYFFDGWRRTNSILSGGAVSFEVDLAGWTSNPDEYGLIVNTEELPCAYGTGQSQAGPVPIYFQGAGAWFYRSP